jgi:subtilisin family serine protease
VALPKRAGLKRPVAISIATVAITAMTMAAATWAEAGPTKAKTSSAALYLVQFDAEPLATYAGGVNGILGTKPASGSKIDTRSWNYDKYRKYLQSRRSDVLSKAKISGKVTAEYDNVLNGVAVALTPSEVVKLRATPGVRNVWKNTTLKLQTADTPKFLGLDGPNGVWQKKFGGVSNAGQGIIVGVLDTGITPESASFAPLSEPRPDADVIAAKWFGTCDTSGENPVECNNKLIGARYYNTDPATPIADRDFLSARDYNGHGTHTSSTAAGNNGVPAVVNGDPVGNISGMAPAARVAMYKVCWEFEDPDDPSAGGCELSDSVAAIDDAIADGVDVINYSIGGTPGVITDPVEISFLQAAAAGVFVATSAGNTPGESTADHNSPWLTTVAASTHDRTFERKLTLGDGRSFTGPGVGPAVPASPLIDSINAVNAGSTPEEARICVIGSLDPAKVTGKIVICQRGVNARTDKGLAVKEAGGVGMVMYNPSPNSLNADFQAVPSIHVDTPTGEAIKTYAATAGATGALTAAVRKKARAPQIASFSSSGPAESSAGDLLKPDITAPGVDVIAAVAPPGNHGNSFDAYSGTSMASPHIAGVAALMKQKNPTWSPAAIKSALMTTAAQTDNQGKAIQREGGIPASPLDYGAGHVQPAPAYDPGLVYDSGPLEWLQFICGAGEDFLLGGEPGCAITGSIDPSNLNYPSIAVGDLAGKQTVTRTVTNTTNQASIYIPKIQAPAGFSVKVTPPVLIVLPRKSASYKMEFTRTNAPYDEFRFGAITWLDLRGHSVRSPIALRATPVGAPAEATGTGTNGSKALQVTPGFNGTLTARPLGLAESKVTTKHLVGSDTGFNTDNPEEGPAVLKATVTVPADAFAARIQTFASQYPAGTDLDMYVYAEVDDESPGKELVAVSGGTTADESVDLPPGIEVDVYVVQFAVIGGEQDVHLHAFAVPRSAAGNLTATPASQKATLGKPTTVTATWSGLTAGKFYMGAILYGEGNTISGETLVTIKA